MSDPWRGSNRSSSAGRSIHVADDAEQRVERRDRRLVERMEDVVAERRAGTAFPCNRRALSGYLCAPQAGGHLASAL